MTQHSCQETRGHGASRMADETRAKVVYFVRHGQSEDNVAPVFQSPDSPLSAVGRHQAARIAARVATLAFDVLLASPYRRAHETAEVISKVTGKTPELCALFTERVKPTSVNGKPFTDAKADTVWRAWTQGRVPIFPVKLRAKPGVKWPYVSIGATAPPCSTSARAIWPRHWHDTRKCLALSSAS